MAGSIGNLVRRTDPRHRCPGCTEASSSRCVTVLSIYRRLYPDAGGNCPRALVAWAAGAICTHSQGDGRASCHQCAAVVHDLDTSSETAMVVGAVRNCV